MNEHQDQDVWYELYTLNPTASRVFQRQSFIDDFSTWDEAEAYAQNRYDGDSDRYRIKRVCGLDER